MGLSRLDIFLSVDARLILSTHNSSFAVRIAWGIHFGFGSVLALGKAFWLQECARVLERCIHRKENRNAVRGA